MVSFTVLGVIGDKKVSVRPARVKKPMVSRNICDKKLAGMNYKFHYTVEESFKEWFKDCNKEGLL